VKDDVADREGVLDGVGFSDDAAHAGGRMALGNVAVLEKVNALDQIGGRRDDANEHGEIPPE
jgi:hypothetical protein